MERERFGSRLGFILVSAGCAIGLGNVWRFPYITGEYGGAAFVVLYLIFLVIFALPVLVMEFAAGRASQRSIARSYDELEPEGRKWHRFKWVGLAGNYLLMMFYTVVAGWMLAFMVKSAMGEFNGASTEHVASVFGQLLADPVQMTIYMLIIVAIGVITTRAGLKNGVERVSKVMMVALFVVLVALCVRAVTLPGAEEGLEFYLMPDFGKLFAGNTPAEQWATFGDAVYAAMGQAFFSLSLGIAAMEIFGSRIGRQRSLTGEAVSVTALNTVVAILAGLIIFPACFAYGVSPDQGPSLVFVTLPVVFGQMPLGNVWGCLFFVFMAFASLSTVIAVFENLISWSMDKWGMMRSRAVIFNAVLVPQIVRTLKEKDAQERLNRLITLAIGILLAMTVVMAAASPLLARLYVGSDDHQMIALTTSFTLWCMPQVFFYGLYTVLGQILAAKDHFLTYAWSSTGANIISCAGFTGFILLFSKANEQPLEFWTADKIALTAGTWTLGVAFQALILFLPLARIGFKYKPSFGLGGFGLRSMGPVALGSLGVVITSEICGIILTRIATSAPQRAHELTGASLFSVAGNATYQNAYTLFILPYSLIAVSVSTAMFPKISRSIAAANLDEARHDLVSALNNVGLLIMFFAAAMVVFPEPIIRALLPSVSMDETMLISYALIALSMGIPLGSAFLLIQRTFYAFEDGLHPFLSAVMQYGFTSIFMIIGMMVLPPEHWVLGIACSVTLGGLLALPLTLMMLRRKFEGNLGGREITRTYAKAIVAALASGVVVWLIKRPVVALLGADIRPVGGHMSWWSALAICVVLTIVLAVVYVAVLWVVHTPELISAYHSILARLHKTPASEDVAVTAQPEKSRRYVNQS